MQDENQQTSEAAEPAEAAVAEAPPQVEAPAEAAPTEAAGRASGPWPARPAWRRTWAWR